MSSFNRNNGGISQNRLQPTDRSIVVSWRQRVVVYADTLWPRTPIGGSFLAAQSWGQYERYNSGTTQKKLIRGITKDPMGQRIGGCLVKLYHTVDDSVLDEIYSDDGGNYTLVTDFTDEHYIVAYRTGSPDYAGTSANTLIPV